MACNFLQIVFITEKNTIMINDNDLNSLNERDNTNSSLGNTEENQQNSEQTVKVQGTTFTKEEIENANKAQPNVILDKVGGAGSSPDYGETGRDTRRVAERANEASDSTDTNTGGIIAGGAKGASQS